MDPLIAELVAEAGAWEQPESAEARFDLSLLLEMHNRPRDWDLYEEYLPLALRVLQFPEADQAEVIIALERMIRDAPTDDARCGLLSCLGVALPSMAMEPALRLLMDPPDAFTEGPTRERVLFVIDHLLDFVGLPDDDPHSSVLDGVPQLLDRFAPEEKLERIATDGPQLESERAISILRRVARLRGGTWRERIPSYAGGKPLEELLASLQDADPGQRRRGLATITQLLGQAECGSDESSEPIEELYRHLTLGYWAQRYVVEGLESSLLNDGQTGDRVTVLGALRWADPYLALNVLFDVLAKDLVGPWDGEEIAALLTAVDEQLRRAVVQPGHNDWGVRSGAEMALPALRRLTSSDAIPVRERAVSILDALSDLQATDPDPR